MKIHYYEDKFFYYFWKPAGVPSTFGKQKSFLEMLLNSKQKNIQDIFRGQKEFFDKNDEYGMLNRLDNNTTGLVYFAKTPLFKQKYKQAQKNLNINKYYLAEVYGKIKIKDKKISYPIGHHKFSSDRMVVFLDKKESHKIKGKKHFVETFLEESFYDEQKNTTILLIKISRGIRHQIRAHLSSIGNPIIGEKIYKKNKDKKTLQLFSIGMQIYNYF